MAPKTPFRAITWGGVALGLLIAFRLFAAGPVASFADARKLFQEGKYAEAEEAYRALSPEHTVAAALGLSACQAATGQGEKAALTLKEASAKQASPDLSAALARLAFERGDYAGAQQFITAALAGDKEQALARWIQAELFCARGKLDEANAAYRELVNQYNQQEIKDPDVLRWIGLGAAEYARWNRLSDQFGFLVNEFYPDLLGVDKSYWQAHYEAGRLFAEKYNQAQASKELKAALELNPNAAEVHAALGELSLDEFEITAAQNSCDRALEINSELLPAWLLKADIHFANFEPRQAAGVLNDALKRQPVSEEVLGRLAAAHLAIDGVTRAGGDTRAGKLIAEAIERNPHAGVFFMTLADALDRLRRWPTAAEYYEQAIQRMPQLIAPPGRLGLMLMRLGDEPRAKQVLDEAFKIDPFNVRVNNSLKVLEVLDGYETHETEHFRIKFDPATNRVLARAMGNWLEEVYPRLVQQMGFAPPEKSLFEVFSKAKNTDGHGWFSARMVGLPNIHPIGACAGKIVALQSPGEGNQRFNWARVLKHEFIHVINLQQTNFNIPHWFTEAIAVLNEGYPRPRAWNELLVESSSQKKLFNLDNINLGFIRPHSSNDWTLAYCQAEIYAEYMLARFGEDAIAKMLAAYADNLTTGEALERSFGTAQPDFERGYSEHVLEIVAALPASAKKSEMNPADIQKGLAKNPKDPDLLAKQAQAQLTRKNYAEARRLADTCLKVQPRHALANYVRARLHLLIGENAEALARLEEGLDRQHPQENLLALLAGLKFKAEEYAAAAELYELGMAGDAGDPKWLKSLSAVYLKSGNETKLAEVLAKLADADPDDVPIRKKLAQLAAAASDSAAVERWTREALQIDVRDVELHVWRAEALSASNPLRAADEYAAAVELEPEEPKYRLALAQTLIKAEQAAKAKEVLQELLKRKPGYPGAGKLLESLP